MRTKERWKDVPGFEGIYKVSNLGKIKRIATSAGKKMNRLFKPYKNPKGGYKLRLTHKRKSLNVCVAHIVLLAFKNKPLKYQVPCYKDGKVTNHKLKNLYWGTMSELHVGTECFRKVARGPRTNRTQLKNDNVRSIKRSLSRGIPQHVLANKFNLTVLSISNIGRGKTWKHIVI